MNECENVTVMIVMTIVILLTNMTSSLIFQSTCKIRTKFGYLSYVHHSELIELINKRKDIFTDVPSVANVAFHDVDIGDYTPIKQNPYRVNPVKRSHKKLNICCKIILLNQVKVVEFPLNSRSKI